MLVFHLLHNCLLEIFLSHLPSDNILKSIWLLIWKGLWWRDLRRLIIWVHIRYLHERVTRTLNINLCRFGIRIIDQYFIIWHYWDQIAKLALQIYRSSFQIDLEFAKAISILATFLTPALSVPLTHLASVHFDCMSSIARALLLK